MSTMVLPVVDGRVPARPVVVRPLRYNFAGFCIHCEELGCTSDRCAAYHEKSRWQICPRCDGRGVDPVTDRGCGFCLFGVVEADS